MKSESGPKAARTISPDQSKITSNLRENLDNLTPDEVLALWARVERVRQQRTVEPEVRAAILARCETLADRFLADVIRAELDESNPKLVVDSHWQELIPNSPAFGAFPRREVQAAPSVDDWLRDDPRRLAGVVHEMARFTGNLKTITEQALALADRLGIDEQYADRVICSALRTIPKRASNVG